jgi:hypothetical protein
LPFSVKMVCALLPPGRSHLLACQFCEKVNALRIM